MKKNWKAVVVALTLGTLAGLAGAMFGKQEAVAMPCCSSCDYRYDYCMSQCAPNDWTCYDNCDAKAASCYSYCSYGC